MKHIVRLIVVAAILFGIGFGIYSLVNNNKPFKAVNYISEVNKVNENSVNKLNEMNNSVNSVYGENLVVFKIYEDNISYYLTFLNNVFLTKEAAGEIVTLYRTYEERLNNIVTSLNSLSSYLSLPEADINATELEGRKTKVNSDFKLLNTTKHSIASYLENYVLNSIYNNKSYDPNFVIRSSLNIIANIYNETGNSFSFVSSVSEKLKDYNLNNQLASEETMKFVIKFNSLNKTDLVNGFTSFMENQTKTEDIAVVIDFLNSEVYYEKV